MSHQHSSSAPGGPSNWRSERQSAFGSRGSSRGRGGGGSGGGSKPSRGGGGQTNKGYQARGKGKGRAADSILSGPIHDEKYIETTYKVKPLKNEWVQNPKAPVSNHCLNSSDAPAVYESKSMFTPEGQNLWRTTVTIPEQAGNIVAYGDSNVKKDSERLAALSALYQLDGADLLNQSGRSKEENFAPTEVTLSDETVVDFERARQFMDYYCRRFGFGKPDVTYTENKSRRGTTFWEAVMTVGGRRIGMGTGANKKASMTSCYVDVTQYLESCDPELWKQFVDDAKKGKDLGLASSFLFQSNEMIEDQIQDVCSAIKDSTLYRNRPKIGSVLTGSDAPEELNPRSAPRYVAPFKRQLTQEAFEHKSAALQQRRAEYIADPRMEKMRNTRAALPIYTKAEEILSHIRDNEVTICMAATGSGKTTQIPQLILDEWTDRGEGARCNIICTQPRRLAAISVAQRVAAERGEQVGKSIGYQVRFEAKLPEDHGSVTFCTTGIFLKRMHSALQDENAHKALDDVTHIVVDEVHERDVDTDLLLVVLKRLIHDRRARNKPLRVLLMSATIDPTLFQEYLPDDQGNPASVIEIPGRSFPVQKNFLDDFTQQLVASSDQSTSWVFRDELVQKYLLAELGTLSALPPQIVSSKLKFPSTQHHSDEDLDLPYPLIAYTISHVLRNSNDGHVLVFLPGWDDITSVQKILMDPGKPLGLNFGDSSKFSIHLLHSTIPVAEQQVIFEPPAEGVRRIILSTNIAETSVTIPDVVYVVDTAKIKEQRYDPDRHISALVSAWVGTSNLNQRAGRAGRHRPGEYYGIIGQRRMNQLHPYQTVEMKRVDLSNVVMHVKALDFPGMAAEEVLAALIEPPHPDRVEAAMQSLKMVGALDEGKNLTSLGRVLLQLPVDPQMGKLVLFGTFFRCLDSALTLASILTNRDPFLSPMHARDEASFRKNSFSPEDFRSDVLATLKAYNAWWAMQSRGEYVSANRFCMDNFLSKPTLLMIQKIKGHLLQSLYDIGVIDVSAGGVLAGTAPRHRHDLEVPSELNMNGDSLPVLASLIAIASQPKFAIRTGDMKYRTSQDKVVFIHPSSVNNRRRLKALSLSHDEETGILEKQIIAYAEKRQNISAVGASAGNAQKFLVTTTRLDPLSYMLFGAYHVDVTRKGLICDEWLPVIGSGDALDDVERLKVLMESCMLRVFEGITLGRSKRNMRGNPMMLREEESGDEDDGDGMKNYALSRREIEELDEMTSNLVTILNDYNTFRVANQSRNNSRPATPMGSPTMGLGGRLPSLSGSAHGSRSGYSTPYSYNSRPGTPSKLSRKLQW
ncbi:P-loop containing nucleoside triphosphate hydrolase protein [Abortiporus biennis]|nr:P-loop containing nucleoside triphosphate hydrolase protein [Abortiporus biennis]